MSLLSNNLGNLHIAGLDSGIVTNNSGNIESIEQISVTQLDSQLQTEISTIDTLSSNVVNLQNEINILNSMSYNSIDLFNKLSKSTSQIQVRFNTSTGVSSGSGWFYAQNTSDLSKGYFITAAHCVMEIRGFFYIKISEGYIHQPITNDWTKINVNNIYIDGIADVALIQTNIDLTNYPEYCLKISDIETTVGQICYVVGNPGGFDEDSISVGYVRDPHYCESAGYQITDSIFTSALTIGGNSGGPIVNMYGEVIGILTFGRGTRYETFSAGSNRETLLNTLNILKLNQNNKVKLYLGIDWHVPNVSTLKKYYSDNSSFSSNGVIIESVKSRSPFNGILKANDILLSAIVNGHLIEFGNVDTQRTPGVLIYYPLNTNITITYIRNQTIITSSVILNKNYSMVSNVSDAPLSGVG